jgi:hypothetical protein
MVYHRKSRGPITILVRASKKTIIMKKTDAREVSASPILKLTQFLNWKEVLINLFL